MVAIIGDKFAVIVSLAKKIGCHFIGCASHRFSPALKYIFNADKDLFQKFPALMMKVRYGLFAALLCKLTLYCAFLVNETR